MPLYILSDHRHLIEAGQLTDQTKNASPLTLTTGGDQAEERIASLPLIAGVEFATAATGIRYQDRSDVMLVRLCADTEVVGFFTQSSTRAAPVLDCEFKLQSQTVSPSAIFANSGNANAFTGADGFAAVKRIAAGVAEELNISADHVLTASTGVIGEPLTPDIGKILSHMPGLKSSLSPLGMGEAARAIMTTDTFPKVAATEIKTPSGPISIAGIAKGSGMIEPQMATMLAFIFTDAKISRMALKTLVNEANSLSFNAITIDSDTSTNDTLLVAATGTSHHPELTRKSDKWPQFSHGLESVMASLAEQIVRDGEGAKKLVRVRVIGAANKIDADRAARAIANSPLVKTAIAGDDPNWGRIVMALGKSGAKLSCDQLTISIGGHPVAENGQVATDYRESQVADYMKGSDIQICIDLGIGKASAQILTCDLTHEYISINADYRS